MEKVFKISKLINYLYTNYNRTSIKYKLFLFFLILTLTIGSFSLLSQQIAFKAYDYQLFANSAEIIGLYSSNIEDELKNIEEYTLENIYNPFFQSAMQGVRSAETPYNQLLYDWQIYNNIPLIFDKEYYTDICIIIDKNVYRVNSVANSPARETISAQDSEIYKEAVSKPGEFLWKVFSKKNVITVATSIQSTNITGVFETLGVLILEIDMNRLVKYRKNDYMKYTTDLGIFIDQTCIYSSTGGDIFEYSNHLYDGKNRYTISNIHNKRYFITYSKSDYNGWLYLHAILYDEIIKDIIFIRVAIIIFGLVLMVVIGYFSLVLAKSLTDPIVKLSRVMKNIEDVSFQNYYEKSRNIKYLNQHDEIGQLYNEFTNMLETINKLINENYLKQIMIKDIQYKSLQAQINPHFLYNTLNSISWIAKLNHQLEISSIVKALGNLLRYTIDNKKQEVTIEEELSLLHDYINIHKIRFGERLCFSTDVGSEIFQCIIPKLILQPLVENSIKYGLELLDKVCVIKISGKLSGQKVILCISDNGSGISQEGVENFRNGKVESKDSGIGLRNTQDRIKHLYGSEYGMEIESAIFVGTKITIILPQKAGEQNV